MWHRYTNRIKAFLGQESTTFGFSINYNQGAIYEIQHVRSADGVCSVSFDQKKQFEFRHQCQEDYFFLDWFVFETVVEAALYYQYTMDCKQFDLSTLFSVSK